MEGNENEDNLEIKIAELDETKCKKNKGERATQNEAREKKKKIMQHNVSRLTDVANFLRDKMPKDIMKRRKY